jgi:hypothetical protein
MAARSSPSWKHLGFKVAVLAPILALGGIATASGAPKPPSCSNVPTSFVFMDPTAASPAIWDDGLGSYKDGAGGVSALIFYNNDCNGSRDARLDLSASTRTLTMQFPVAIPNSLIAGQGGPASFAGGVAFPTHDAFLIRNIVGHNTSGITPSEGTTQGVAATYYTKVTYPFTGPDGQGYRVMSFPDNTTCPAICVSGVNDVTDPLNNLPVQAAWAKVTYMPRDVSQPWSETNKDTWLVEGEVTTNEPPAPDAYYQRGTLWGPAPRHGKTTVMVHFGQYSMPYKILVTALAPMQ